MSGREEYKNLIHSRVQNLAREFPILEDFYQYMKVSGLEDQTCMNYCYHVSCFLRETGVDYCKATPSDVIKFLYAHKKGDKPQTLLTVLWYGLNKFYSFLVSVGEVETNIVKSIDKPKSKSSNDIRRTYLTPDECDRFLDAIKELKGEDLFHLKRDTAVFRILIETGIRVSALVNINMADLDQEKHLLKVTDKGNKTTYYPLEKRTYAYVYNWWLYRHLCTGMDIYHDDLNDEPLFISRRGNRLTSDTVRSITKTYGKMIGRPELSPHKFRASFATNLYNATKDIRFVQESMNHANVTTTQLYVQPEKDVHLKASEIMAGLVSR